MHLFYSDSIIGNEFVLNEEESKHCVRVLRLQKGDVIYLTDGNGGFYKAVLNCAEQKKCIASIIEKHLNYGKRNYYLHIAIAPTKNIDRIEWFLEKATEIGIDEITPLLCKRSERTIIKHERLNKIIESAMKQSLKTYYPKLNEMMGFNKFVQSSFDGTSLIAHCMEGEKTLLKEGIPAKSKTLILIGPEGDFTEEEVSFALRNDFKTVSLGESRLRTETAALYCCAAVNFINSGSKTE